MSNAAGVTVSDSALLAPLERAGDKEAIRFGERAVSYKDLRDVAAQLAQRLAGRDRVAVWATPSLETCVSVVGALAAGIPVVPINPKSGERELGHIVRDSEPSVVLAAPGSELPPALGALERVDVELDRSDSRCRRARSASRPRWSSTRRARPARPRACVLPRRAIATNLDALAQAWQWTGDDVLTHGLPLFHVHGLVLGVLGPLRLGGAVHHLGSFSIEAVAAELGAGGATMLFGVPTMYHRLAEAAESRPAWWRMRSSGPDCWSPDRPRCRRPITSGSSARAGSA